MAKKAFFGKKAKEHQAQTLERKKRERLKKFPSIAIADRPMPPANRGGPITPEEKAVIQLLVQDQPQDISKEQVEMLSKLMRRTPGAIKHLILQARDQFADNAKSYVDTHLRSVQAAYGAGEFDVAARHAEWAMENLSHEGTTIIEKVVVKRDDATPKILIGVNMGGITAQQE